MASGNSGKQRSGEEWRAILSPEQFRILRLKGTESVLIPPTPYPLLPSLRPPSYNHGPRVLPRESVMLHASFGG